MSDTFYAAALGLAIPVLGISVCGRLLKHGRAALRGRKIKDRKDSLYNIGFAVRTGVLIAACVAFKHVASSMKLEPEFFDPYQILELPARGANSSMIRSQYRRLSLRYHPDKNPGNRKQAGVQFNKVANAYKALSDSKARKNWEEYGHPDGYQPWTFDLALPAWLTPDKDTDKWTMLLYAIGYIAVLVGFVVSVKAFLDMLDPNSRQKAPAFKVTQEDVQALLNNLDESSSTEDVIECLAACPQLCTEERRALAKDMSPTTKPILRRLVARGASSLRSAVPRESGRTARNGGGKGKGKGRGKGKGGSSAGKGKHGSGGSNGAVAEESVGVGEATEDTGEVEEEFFSKGRRGEGNRRAARSSSDLKEVMTHNLIVLLSALYREGVVVDSAVDSDTASSNSADDDSGNEDKPHRDGDDEKSAAETATGATEGNGIASGGLAGAAAMTEAQAQAARALSDEQEALFGLAEPLLDACLRVAAERESPRLLGTVVEAKAMLRRRLWSSEDGEALSAQAAETDLDLDAAVPRVKVKSIVAETWGESQVAVGDTVTATITIEREHACEYQGFRRRRPVDGFLSRGEPWWVILSSGRGGTDLLGVVPVLVENLGSGLADCKIKFDAPRRACMMPLTVSVKSPVFVGVDCEGSTALRVYRHDEIKEDYDTGGW